MKLLCIAMLFLFLSGCAASEPAPAAQAAPAAAQAAIPPTTLPPTTLPPDPVEELLSSMTLEEKVGQLFLARCPIEGGLEDLSTYHLGGYVLFSENLEHQTPETLRATLELFQTTADIPLLIAVDEEGGTVCRISSNPAFRSSPFPSPRQLYAEAGLEMVLSLEVEKGYLLSQLGINVNLGPVCDIATDRSAFLYSRSLGESPEITGQFAAGAVEMLREFGVGAVLKHFPGYGNNADTHTGTVVDRRSLAQLEEKDLIPFRMAIEAGCDAIMVGHTIVNAMDEEFPASLSPAVHSYLRSILGFDGVIVTDDLVMEAIRDTYGAGEAAVLAVLAGNDLICSTEYAVQYDAVLEAAESGRISTAQLDRSVERILRWKQELGLIA